MAMIGKSIIWRSWMQYYADKATPYFFTRWTATAIVTILYGIRVCILHQFYYITYTAVLFILSSFFAYSTPLAPPPPLLPVKSDDDDEYRPFIPAMPEFTLWWNFNVVLFSVFGLSFIPIFDIGIEPYSMTILGLLFIFTNIFARISHMIKFKYIPKMNFRKKKYGAGKKPAVEASVYDSRAEEKV